uniref:Uncharacterized protein n=1 Tax=Acanthochromis polyacanthus TaxID=80966 RepID=A0A3Q1EXW2_9TELE
QSLLGFVDILCIIEVRENKRQLDRENAKTKVIIGESFGRWRQLKQQMGLKTDALVAIFLLDRKNVLLELNSLPWVV